jgi:hypothetical protein
MATTDGICHRAGGRWGARIRLPKKARSLLGAVALIVAGCGPDFDVPLVYNEPIEGAEPLRVMWFSGRTVQAEHPPGELDMAADILGIELSEVAHFSWGVVLMEHVQVRTGFLGRAFGTPSEQVCTPVIRTMEDPHIIAHELGHVLGLGHHPNPKNLMYGKKGGYLLEVRQEVVLRDGTHWYQRCFEDYNEQN